jgi:hypothetical protein
MDQHLVGSILGRSFIKIPHLVPIRLQTWSPQAILVSDWSISNKSLLWSRLAKWSCEPKLRRKHPCKVLDKDCSFSSDLLTNMATKSNSCFWLVNFYNTSNSKTTLPNESKHGRKHHWKDIYKDCSFSSDLFKKHGYHRQFLFLIGWFLKNRLLWSRLAKWIETW